MAPPPPNPRQPRSHDSTRPSREINSEAQSRRNPSPRPSAGEPRRSSGALPINTNTFVSGDAKQAENYPHGPAQQPPPPFSDLVLGFLQPAAGEYRACEDFCKKNPAIWTSYQDEVDKFRKAVTRNLSSKRYEQARRFAERWLMVHHAARKRLTAAKAVEFLRDLRYDDDIREAFEKGVQNVIEELRPENEEEDEEEADNDNNDGNPKISTSISLSSGRDNRSYRELDGRNTANLVVGLKRGDSGGDQTSRLRLTSQPGYTSESRGFIADPRLTHTSSSRMMDPRTPQLKPSSTTSAKIEGSTLPQRPVTKSRRESQAGARTLEIRTHADQPKNIESETEGLGPNFGFLEDYEGKDDLNASYILREGAEADEFYVKGRVFSMVWHENAGIPNSSKVTKALDKPFHVHNIDVVDKPFHRYTTTRDRIMIFSHIRRFVVVKQRKGYCWAIPINSYGGRALTDKNMSSAEQQAHTIVHAVGTRARYMEGEVRLVKKPIAVQMTGNQKLTEASRLHFDKPQSIEFNIKVRDVGLISGPTDLRHLVTYFAQEFNRDEEPRSEKRDVSREESEQGGQQQRRPDARGWRN